MMVVLRDMVLLFLGLSGEGSAVPSLTEMKVSLLRLGEEQLDRGERSRPGRPSALPPLDHAGDPGPSALGTELRLGEEWVRGEVEGLKPH